MRSGVARRGLGRVYIVGAGPGDPSLITRRGAELLARADVVCYDRLVHPDLLALAPRAELVDVGKRPGQSAEGQRTINDLLVEHARAGKIVVRLKGGDPFVFGRGGEEAEVLAAAGVPFEIVPGVTSAIAGPAYAGIPLTHRDHASWAAFATGHEEPTKDASALDWDALARAPTAVFLMGMERLDTISAELQRAGRAPDTPVAVIERATWPDQRVLRSTLEKVADAVTVAGIGPPAVLVVGSVTTLADTLDWIASKPLSGKKVFVTRTRAQAGKLSAMVRELGGEPLELPAIRITDPSSFDALDRAIERLASYAWVVFGSTNAVDAVWSRLGDRDARSFGSSRVAAVGPATAEALRARGINADLVPPTFTSEALAAALGSGSGDILVSQAEGAPEELVAALEGAGWRCNVAAAYRTVTDDTSVATGRDALDRGVDAVVFTSASTVRSFVQLWGAPRGGVAVVTIGPRTSEAAAELGIAVGAEADPHTLEGLVNALVELVGR
jgi:uroporphyrinogen III methyltransferase / synthase